MVLDALHLPSDIIREISVNFRARGFNAAYEAQHYLQWASHRLYRDSIGQSQIPVLTPEELLERYPIGDYRQYHDELMRIPMPPNQ